MKWSTFNWPFNCLMIERRRIKISIWSDHESNKVDVLLFQFLFAPFGSSKWTFRLIECIRNLVKKIHVQWAELSIINTEGFRKSTKLPFYSTKWKIRLYSTTEIGVKVVLRCHSWKWNIVDILPFPGKIYSHDGAKCQNNGFLYRPISFEGQSYAMKTFWNQNWRWSKQK